MASIEQVSLNDWESGTRLPQHIAIIMDGNGRWAKKRFLPRIAGHQQGARAVRSVVESAVHFGVKFLTLFAFSTENWNRPEEEVSGLFSLLVHHLQSEQQELNKTGVRLRVIGDRASLDSHLQDIIREAEQNTLHNTKLGLNLAINYGGQWDIVQAVNHVIGAPGYVPGVIEAADIKAFLSLQDIPEPDLFIRTGGEQRISNFLMWQLAYTELYFTDVLWPDFGREEFGLALVDFGKRQRRFGRV